MPRCINCQKDLPADSFSNKQLKNKAGPKCKDCAAGKNPVMNEKPVETVPTPISLPASQPIQNPINTTTPPKPAWGVNSTQKTQAPAKPVQKKTEQPPPPQPTVVTDIPPLPTIADIPGKKEEPKVVNPYRDLEIYKISIFLFIYLFCIDDGDPKRPNVPIKYAFKVLVNMFKIGLDHMCQYMNHYDLQITVPSSKVDVKIKDEITTQVMNYVEKTLLPSLGIKPTPLLIFDGKKQILVNQILPFTNDCFEADVYIILYIYI